MQYLLHPDAGAAQIVLEDEPYRYLIKVRRHRVGDRVALRTGEDDTLYHYTLTHIDRRRAELTYHAHQTLPITPARSLRIGWCMIDPKIIEKTLPTLNEIGVAQITFIQCARSQAHFRLDFARLQKILTNSSQQSGRSTPMQLDTAPDIATFLADHPEAYVLHFSEHPLSCADEVSTIIIGPEGGLSTPEIAHLSPDRILGLDTPLILRSESAAIAAASRIIL